MTMTNAVVLIEADRDALSTLGGELAGIEGVAEAYSVTGEWDFVAIVRVPHHEQLADVVTGAIVVWPGSARRGGLRQGRALGPRREARGLLCRRPAAAAALCRMALGRATGVRLAPDQRAGGTLPRLRVAGGGQDARQQGSRLQRDVHGHGGRPDAVRPRRVPACPAPACSQGRGDHDAHDTDRQPAGQLTVGSGLSGCALEAAEDVYPALGRRESPGG